MAFLDFLKRKSTRASPDDEAAAIEAAFAQLAQDRAAAEATLAGLDSRRDKLLRDDAPDGQIIALDAEGDAARIRIEKFDVFGIELQARQSELAGLGAEREWRDVFDAYHDAGCDYASALNSAVDALFKLRHAMSAVAADDIGRRLGLDAPPILLHGELLQKFLREIERASDFEYHRRAAVDRRVAEAVTAEV
jgi:hypothetical protein